jgi:glycine cleavage system aminomethyltransferase T
MGYVESSLAQNGTTLEIKAGEARLAARVAPRPFYKRGSRRS